MSVNLSEEADGKVLSIELAGKLSKADYERFAPEVERLAQQHGKVSLFVQLRDFHGWTGGALWEDMKFAWENFSKIERIGFVGDKKWEAGMALFCKPFTRAKIRYFDEHNAFGAKEWVSTGEALSV